MYVQAGSQDRWGVRDPPKVDLLDPKSGLFETHPLNPPTKKKTFLVHFVAKSGPYGRFRGCVPLATGLCMYVSEICAEGIFVTLPWRLKKCENERHFEIWFPKKKTITFFWSRLCKLHKKDPILHVTTTFSLKQWETRTSCGPTSPQLTAHNRQNWKSIFLTCLCHEICRVEAVDPKPPIILEKLWIFWICEIWGNFVKKGYFVNNCLIIVRI